jgi:hypothetical protein
MTKELGDFHTHDKHIVPENPSGAVPEEEYIALASDRFKEVEGTTSRKFKFQEAFPIASSRCGEILLWYWWCWRSEPSSPLSFVDPPLPTFCCSYYR